MPDSYNRPYRTYPEQVELLRDRGIAILDEDLAAVWLHRIGYYRLRPYWLALVDPDGQPFSGRTFQHVVDLYIFDQKLRRCLSDGLENLEIALRVDVSHSIGRRDATGHRNVHHLDASQSFAHNVWLERADAQLEECREQWLDDFSNTHSGHVPTWMAVEAWSFAIVSRLYTLMHRNDQAKIAKRFMVNPVTFASWTRAAVTLRNSCAHHNRVWNKPLIDQPATPKTWEAKSVQHIGETRLSQTRVYSMIAILAHCLGVVGGKTEWSNRLHAIVREFPEDTGLSIRDAGFPPDWERNPVWS